MKRDDRPLVLLVDDSPEDRDAYRRYLERDSQFTYEILEASSVEAGLDLCKQRLPDVMLLDYLLPDGNGLEFLVELERMLGQQPMAVVMLTGQGNEAIAVQAIKQGVQDYLVKGQLSQDSLCWAVHAAMVQFRLQQQIKQQQQVITAIAIQQAELVCSLQTLNAQLEEKVQTRTTTLQQINQELQAEVVRRQVSESALKQTHQELDYLIDHTPLATIQWDWQFRVQIWSSRAEEMFGWKAEEVIGKNIFEWRFIYEEDIEVVNQVTAEILANPQNSSIGHNRNCHKDGSIVYCEWYNSVLVDEAGELISFLSLAQDVSDRHRLEEERQQVEAQLRRSQAHLTLAQRIAQVGSWELDISLQTRIWSEETFHIFGLDPSGSEPTQAEFLQMVHPDDRPTLQHYLERTISEGVPLEMEYRIVRLDGSIRQLETKAEQVMNAPGQAAKVVGSIRDISDRRQAEISLRKSESRFRTVFEQAAIGLEYTDLEGRFLLVNQRLCDLLGYSREELLSLKIQDIIFPDDLPQTFQPSQQLLAGEISSYSLDLRSIGKDGTLLWVNLTVSLVYEESGQPQFTLAAIKDITTRKQSDAALRQSEERWQLAIQGNNDGIWDQDLLTNQQFLSPRCLEILGYAPNEVATFAQWLSYVHPDDLLLLQNAFQKHANHETPYYFCEYRMRCKDGGYKWLLVRGKISQQFARLLGGELKVSSVLGRGSTFTVSLPVSLEEIPSASERSQPRAIALAPGQPIYRILLVEDTWSNRRLMLNLLSPLGFEVKEAVNGQDAIVLWENWRPHLIWMDIRMPVMDGYEAIRHIRQAEQGTLSGLESDESLAHPLSPCKIIALTASAFEEERTHALAVGCDDFVRKPLQRGVILEKIAEHLGVHYLYQQPDKYTDEYKTISDRASHPDSFLAPPRFTTLSPACLQVFSPDWIRQLHQASTQLDSKQILDLLKRVPEEHRAIAQALQEKVKNFDFEQIMDLTQQALDQNF